MDRDKYKLMYGILLLTWICICSPILLDYNDLFNIVGATYYG